MDTKWRKSKIILSFTAFFLGITLLFGNFFSMIGLIASQDGDTLADRIGEDYQGTAEFCWYMSNRLEELLGVATGGKGWNSYGVTYGGDGYYYYKDYFDWYDDWYYEDTVTSSEENVAEVIPAPPEEQEQAAEGGYGYYGNEAPEEEILARHMKELAGDKNVLYAVVYQGKLLYTNIADAEEKIGKEVGNYDFSNNVSPEEYNFCLWYNLTGDGKVQITKDGQSVDVYGDGVYTEDSRWYVPGYTNFSVDPSTKDAVIFLAAAKEPKLYVAGNYSEYGTVHQGGRLYYMQKTQQERHRRYETGMIAISAAVLLLILAFFMRKSRKAADEAIAGLLRKIWLELKVLLFVGISLVVFWYNGREVLRELMWMLSEADGWYMMEEVFWYLGRFARNGAALAVAFWMIYLAVVDYRYNKGEQKKLFAPVAAALSRRNLELPVARRIVSRYYPVLLLSILCPFLGITAVFGNFLYLGWRTGSRMTWLLLTVLAMVSGVAFLAATVFYLRRNKQLAKDLDALSAQIADIRNGNLTKPLELSADADLKRAAENLNEIQQGMETALKEQTKSERMKVELVANVSHDIKTPLTSIVSYVELLKQEEELPEHVKEYVQILGEKSERLKTMVQDVFEISKAASNQLPMNMERLDLGKLLRQTLADMNGQILESGLVLKVSLPEAPVLILADGQRLYRVFQNLIQNALKYSLKGSRIFLTLTEEGKTAAASIKNTSGVELESGIDFTERFVRGDESRTDGGSGLGLSIAKSFTEACGGSFSVDVNADLFTVTAAFARISG